MNLSTIANEATEILNALGPVIALAVPETAPAIALVHKLIVAAEQGEKAAADLLAFVRDGGVLTAEQVRQADAALDGALADLLAALDAADKAT